MAKTSGGGRRKKKGLVKRGIARIKSEYAAYKKRLGF